MRHVSEIAKELGFNEDAPESLQQAFLRHLRRAAASTPSTIVDVAPPAQPEQLSFNFDELEAPANKIAR